LDKKSFDFVVFNIDCEGYTRTHSQSESNKHVIPATPLKHVPRLHPTEGSKHAIPTTPLKHVPHLHPSEGSKHAIPATPLKHVPHLHPSEGTKHAILATPPKVILFRREDLIGSQQ
jgi:hypothetical protein